MPTPLYNAVRNLTAYGYGDTRNGVTAYTPEYEGFQEYLVDRNQTFFLELGSLYIPALFAPLDGIYITYCNPGFSYKRRQVFRPSWVPKRKDFVAIVNGSLTPTIDEVYNHFNQPGDPGDTNWERVVIKVNAAGFTSWGKTQYFNNDYKEILVSANGQFTVEYVTFPYTNANNPNPGKNYSGVQVGKLIKFFTEDEFSIIVFDDVEDIGTAINTVPVSL